MEFKKRRYRVLVADPAWKFRDSLPGPKRGASTHYRCEPLSEIARTPLPRIHDDAYLFLWRVAAMPEEALIVARVWGFRVVGEIPWIKTTQDGYLRLGLGHHVRNAHETCLVATRGKASSIVRRSRAVPSVICAPRAQHSAKPDEFFRAVRELTRGPRCSLFERTPRAGFDCYGEEMQWPA